MCINFIHIRRRFGLSFVASRGSAAMSEHSEDEYETAPEIDGEQTVELGPAEGEFQIFVYPMTGEAITLDVQDSYTITMLKAKIQDKENVPWFEIQLMFGHDMLVNNKTLKMCLIPPNANLTMVRMKASDRDLIDLFQIKEPPTLYNLMQFSKQGGLVCFATSTCG